MEINIFKQYAKTVRFVGRVAKEDVLSKNKVVSAKNIKNDIVKMGPVYVKIGQIVSTRTDLFPDYITDVFSDLQNEVEYMEFDDVEHIFQSQFNKSIDDCFDDFSPQPIASASIGQVHIGTLKENNTKVAIKVLRKGIDKTFKDELSVIINMFNAYNSVMKLNKNASDILAILKELYNNIEYETNFEKELKNMMIFKSILDDNTNIVVPRVYKPLSSREILTMEYVPSVKITDLKSNKNELLATELMKIFVLMILNDGYIHCDPHPGNIGINSDGKIVLYDFGMVKKFDLNIKEYFRKIFFALMNQSTTELIEFMLNSGILIAKESNGTNISTLTGYETILLERLLNYVYNYLNNLDIKILVKSINEDKYIDVNDIPFEFDTQLVYLFKSFSTLEGVCKQIYSDFNYIDFMSEVVIEFFDLNMLMDKMVYDIQSTTLQQKGNYASNQNYTKMSIEKLNKQLESQNKNLIIFLILSILFDFLSFGG